MTHINAYYGAVEEAKAKVDSAQAELLAAKEALSQKQKEDEPAEAASEEPTEETTQDSEVVEDDKEPVHKAPKLSSKKTRK